MKRHLAITLISCLCLTLLSGCSTIELGEFRHRSILRKAQFERLDVSLPNGTRVIVLNARSDETAAVKEAVTAAVREALKR